VAPTLLDLAGLPTDGCDGRSLRPLLQGQETPWRQSFFYEHHYHHQGKIPRTEGIRTPDWKYITYFDVHPAHEELYDLKKDPREERNLAGEAAQRDRLLAMRQLHQDYVSKLPPPVLPKPRPKKP
jgi:arylsulfatase A-like enzyme